MVMRDMQLRSIREERNKIDEQKAALLGVFLSFCVGAECVWVQREGFDPVFYLLGYQ